MSSNNTTTPLAYGHIPRTETLKGNISSLGQALGTHINARQPQQFQENDYRINSPSTGQAEGSSSHAHSPIFPIQSRMSSPALKRKQSSAAELPGAQSKRRKQPADDIELDGEGSAGSKHWSDDEKSKLYTWLMGREHDDHWNALRATKNSCLRECASAVFEGKKSYQALKGCYERNFVLFRQIYHCETFNTHNGLPPIQNLPEAERLHEQDRRLQLARKAGLDIGNISARIVDHWHQTGWYELFLYRWNEDPALVMRHDAPAQQVPEPPPELHAHDETPLGYSSQAMHPNPEGLPQALLHPYGAHPSQPCKDSLDPAPAATSLAGTSILPPSPPSGTNLKPPVVTLNITNTMMQQYMDHLRVQTQYNRMKLDYLRRKEEREERDSRERRELEQQRLDREATEFEYRKQVALSKEKADRAIQLLGSAVVDASIKQYASDYLKKLLTTD